MATSRPNEYEVIREMIVKGQVLPNERLVEADYALMIKTNRANIRRAFARLEQEGLIVSEPFRGARVRRLTQEEAVEIFEVRGVLEVLVARRAAERATTADKELLQVMQRKVVDALKKDDPLAVGTAARRLREELWRISGHSTAVRIVSSLNSQLVRIWFQSVAIPGRADSIVASMSEVVEGICAGSTEKAGRAMKRYHDAAVVALKRALGRKEDNIGAM